MADDRQFAGLAKMHRDDPAILLAREAFADGKSIDATVWHEGGHKIDAILDEHTYPQSVFGVGDSVSPYGATNRVEDFAETHKHLMQDWDEILADPERYVHCNGDVGNKYKAMLGQVYDKTVPESRIAQSMEKVRRVLKQQHDIDLDNPAIWTDDVRATVKQVWRQVEGGASPVPPAPGGATGANGLFAGGMDGVGGMGGPTGSFKMAKGGPKATGSMMGGGLPKEAFTPENMLATIELNIRSAQGAPQLHKLSLEQLLQNPQLNAEQRKLALQLLDEIGDAVQHQGHKLSGAVDDARRVLVGDPGVDVQATIEKLQEMSLPGSKYNPDDVITIKQLLPQLNRHVQKSILANPPPFKTLEAQLAQLVNEAGQPDPGFIKQAYVLVTNDAYNSFESDCLRALLDKLPKQP